MQVLYNEHFATRYLEGEGGPTVPRPREFDEDEVIERAMTLFWVNGYEATSIPQLEEATGISRISLYNAFGDKEGLFLQVLDKYYERAAEIYQGIIARGGLDAIIGLFEMLVQPAPPEAPNHAGCLMVNIVLDIQRAKPSVREKVQIYRSMLRSSFAQALHNARAAGEMEADDVTIANRAEYLVGLLWGALATIRVNCSTESAAAMVAIGNATIHSWRQGS